MATLMAPEAKIMISLWVTLGSALWAQVEGLGTPVAPGLSALGSIGSFGLIAYLIVWGLPALQKEWKAERKQERDDFLAEQCAARTVFAALMDRVLADRQLDRVAFAGAVESFTKFANVQIDSIRATAKEETKEMRTTFALEQKESRAFYGREGEATRQLFVDTMGAFRTAVHDMRDAASSTMNKAQVAIEVAKQKGL